MTGSRADAPAVGGGSAQGWGGAIVRAIVMVAVALLALGLIPNWLLDRTATRLTPTGRDLVLLAWWLIALLLCGWVFVRLQGRERSGS